MAGRIRRMWEALKRPPVRMSLGAVLIIGAVSALVGWGSFVFVIHETSTNEFCANACHEMNISFAEYQTSVHAHNATGVTRWLVSCLIGRRDCLRVFRRDLWWKDPAWFYRDGIRTAVRSADRTDYRDNFPFIQRSQLLPVYHVTCNSTPVIIRG